MWFDLVVASVINMKLSDWVHMPTNSQEVTQFAMAHSGHYSLCLHIAQLATAATPIQDRNRWTMLRMIAQAHLALQQWQQHTPLQQYVQRTTTQVVFAGVVLYPIPQRRTRDV